ncbi:TonB-dependent receptor [Solimonas flava]|uniref:TonB-dependent receptor n=1 Tax=Solimonas flava TaxID=415849 RepID=UPI000422A9EB|nr:TonB-dependent receptor [Solimonas flava]
MRIETMSVLMLACLCASPALWAQDGDASAPAPYATLPVPAAPEPPPAVEPAPAAPPALEEIVVTAEKRSDRLQRVPLAITAITADQREERGIKSVNDIADVTPGLSYDKGTGSDRISVRGIGRLTSAIGTDAGIAVYNDGVFTGSGTQIQKSPLFVDRVEVLRGPQGTLYGQNSIGGAINVVSKRPSSQFDAQARGAYGSYGAFELEGFVSGPLRDGLLGRLSLSQTGQQDAQFDNEGPADGLGREQHRLAEAQLQFGDGAPWQVWTRLSYREWDDRKPTANLVTPYVRDQFSNAVYPNPAYRYEQENPGVGNFHRINTNRDSVYQINENYAAVLEASYDLGAVRAKYLGGWQTLKLPLRGDFDRTARGDFRVGLPGDPQTFTLLDPDGYTISGDMRSQTDVDKTYWSNELTFSGEDERLRWIAGLYESGDRSTTVGVLRNPGQPQYEQPLTQASVLGVPSAALPNPARDVLRTAADLDVRSYSGFGQLDWHLSERAKLSFGLRYTRDEKKAREQLRIVLWSPSNNPLVSGLSLQDLGATISDQLDSLIGLNPGLDTGALPPTDPLCCTGRGDNEPAYDITPTLSGAPASTSGPAVRHLDRSWTGRTGRLAFDYAASRRALVYASYARGYKAGGFRLGGFSQDYDVGPEHADAFELGLKSDWTPLLRTNLALFYTQYRDAQVPLLFDNGVTADNLFINLERSRSYGAELESQWIALRGLSFNFSYSWLVAEIQSACCFVNLEVPPEQRSPQALDGNRLPFAPEHKASLNGLYRYGFERGDLLLSATYSWRDKTDYQVFNDPRARADAYGTLGARLAWIDRRLPVQLALFGSNLLDEQQVTNIELGTGAGVVGYGKVVSVSDPRLVGLEMLWYFQ